MTPRSGLLSTVALMIVFAAACGKAPGVPQDDSSAPGDAQRAPFEYDPQGSDENSGGPALRAASKVPEGTPVTIHLTNTLSSANAHAGDTFAATLDDPIVIQGQTTVPRGVAVTGRVLAAKASGRRRDPGYLRIALTSLTLDGNPLAIETSSLFVKGGPHDNRDSAISTNSFLAEKKGEISFDAGRRLTFRLAQPVEFH